MNRISLFMTNTCDKSKYDELRIKLFEAGVTNNNIWQSIPYLKCIIYKNSCHLISLRNVKIRSAGATGTATPPPALAMRGIRGQKVPFGYAQKCPLKNDK